MADNIQVSQGTGTVMATDDVAGVQYPRVKISVGADGSATDVSSAAPMPVEDAASNASLSSIDDKIINDGEIIESNSSVAPLGIDGVFTGEAFEVTKYAAINVCVFSNVASATNGVKVEFSPDGTNWDHSHATTYTAATGVGYIFNAEFKFARVVYTNGSIAQGAFRLQTIVKKNLVKQSLYTIDQAVAGSMFAELGKNVIIGKTTAGGGDYVAVKVNPSGALTVDTGLEPLTDAELRATPVPVSATSLPLPSGAATEATLTSVAGLSIPQHDNIALTYVTSGNGIGKIEQVVYKVGATTVGTLTLAYNANNKLSTVTKS